MDPHAFENCTCFNLRKATRALTQRYDNALRPTGLGANQIAILFVVKALGPIGMSDLASHLVMDRTTLTRNLKPLVEASYLASDAGEDKRRRLISVTPNGQGVLTDAEPLWRSVQSHIADSLGPARWERLLGDLNRLTQLV